MPRSHRQGGGRNMTMRSILVRALLIAVTAAAGAMPADAWPSGPVMAVNPKTMKFIAIPDMPSCTSAAILRGDPRSGPAWVLLKVASGCQVPWHWHTATEELV